jgi:hypothetical protein
LQAGAVRFTVKLTPKGGRDAIDGWQTDSGGRQLLKARVSAAPADGKANAALVALLAKALAIGRTRVTIVSGTTSRVKAIEVAGDSALIGARLAQLGTLD